MNKAEIIEQVKKMIFGSEKEIKMASAKLEDGTEVYVDGPEFKVGDDLYTIDGEGQKVPVFDAEHKLEDGTVVVSVNGKITEIKPIETLADVIDDEDVVDDMVEEEKKIEEEKMQVDVEILDRISKCEEKIAQIESEYKEMKNKSMMSDQEFKNVKDATLFLAEEFSKTPGGEKIEIEKRGFENKFSKKSGREDRLKELMRIINN